MADGNSSDSLKPRPQFGSRFLTEEENVFQHNAWDAVEWDEAQENAAKTKITENSVITFTSDQICNLEEAAAERWNEFYGIHQNRFFKDRHWLFTEFPEVAPHLDISDEDTDSDCTSVLTEESPSKGKLLTPTNSEHNNSNIDDSNCANANANSESVNSVSEQLSSTVINCKSDNTDSESVNNNTTVNSIDDSQLDESIKVAINKLRENESYVGENSSYRILEVGCGVGNTVFPIMELNKNNPDLFIYCCDFSETAVNILKENPDYDPKRCCAFKCDLSKDKWSTPFPAESLDAIVCIFVLSALHLETLRTTVKTLSSYLKPGGKILFRDYGRYDLAQLRFKKGRCLADHFYARGDGTRCYFFTQDEVKELMTDAGLTEIQNISDRRLQVNRRKQLTMYRVWIQAKYQKPQLI